LQEGKEAQVDGGVVMTRIVGGFIQTGKIPSAFKALGP
jgi:hypothetical protein